MLRDTFFVSLVFLFTVHAVTVAGPALKSPKPKVGEKNSNAILLAHKDALKLSASTTWQGWPVESLVDQNEESSWYSQSGDSPSSGQKTWVQVTLPENAGIQRVTILGNRDPNYKDSYLVYEGKIELLDADGKAIASQDVKASQEKYDFDWILNRKTKARSVKFTATKNQENYACIGLAELLVE